MRRTPFTVPQLDKVRMLMHGSHTTYFCTVQSSGSVSGADLECEQWKCSLNFNAAISAPTKVPIASSLTCDEVLCDLMSPLSSPLWLKDFTHILMSHSAPPMRDVEGPWLVLIISCSRGDSAEFIQEIGRDYWSIKLFEMSWIQLSSFMKIVHKQTLDIPQQHYSSQHQKTHLYFFKHELNPDHSSAFRWKELDCVSDSRTGGSNRLCWLYLALYLPDDSSSTQSSGTAILVRTVETGNS